jgi:hypothetical protein
VRLYARWRYVELAAADDIIVAWQRCSGNPHYRSTGLFYHQQIG